MPRKFFADQKFHPSRLGLVLNPYYFLRRGLLTEVKATAGTLKGKLVDFGCGSQPYRRYFTAVDSYIGMDIEASGHDHGELNSLIDVYYDGKNWPFETGSIDNIFSSETFEHVFNLPENLAEMHRVLKPDGTLFATIPFAFPEHEHPYDYARYTIFGLRDLLAKAGFDKIEIRKSGTAVTAISQLWSAYIFQNIGAKHPALALLCQLLIIAPGTMVAAVMDWILPKNRDLYCSLIVRARKAS
jgi:SAM-dependent methyltransferase